MDTIAEHVGVSKMTVSRVLNGRGFFKDSTAKKIEAAALELGYFRRNPRDKLCAALAPVAALLPSWADAGAAGDFLDGLAFGLRESGRPLVAAAASALDFSSGMNPFAGTAGVAVFGAGADLSKFFDGGEFLPPVVFAGSPVPENFDCVAWDFSDAAEKIAARLLEQNFSKIAFASIKGVGSDFSGAKFAEIMKKLGAKEKFFGEFKCAEVSDADKIFGDFDRPDAVLCSCAELARAVLETARGRGLAVPDDIAVASLGDGGAEGGITCAVADLRALGAAAAKLILEKIGKSPRRGSDEFPASGSAASEYSYSPRSAPRRIPLAADVRFDKSTDRPKKSIVWVL